MNKNSADNFFNDVNYVSIVDNIKGIFVSDGSMARLLDFERVLDEADLYAFKNWLLGELVQGPTAGRYTTACIFMWPYKLMPDPTGAKRLASFGCNVKFAKTKMKVPIEIKNESDFVAGTKYPKLIEGEVWLIQIEIPNNLMNDIKEGTIELSDQTIDLDDLDEAYNEDLDKENTQQGGMDDMGGMEAPAPVPGPGIQ